MYLRGCLLFGSLLFAASAGTVDPVTYVVTVDTSAISGATGSLDFNFNPGPLVSQLAYLQVLDFSGNGTLGGAPSLTGNVSGGPLPATVTFDNGTGFNDYFQGFTFGTTLLFDVHLYGPALSSPDGSSTSGSTFAFSMFSDAAGTVPALTTDLTNGFAFTVDLDLIPSTVVSNFSAETGIVQVYSDVPEPNTHVLLGTALACWGMLRFRRRTHSL